MVQIDSEVSVKALQCVNYGIHTEIRNAYMDHDQIQEVYFDLR